MWCLVFVLWSQLPPRRFAHPCRDMLQYSVTDDHSTRAHDLWPWTLAQGRPERGEAESKGDEILPTIRRATRGSIMPTQQMIDHRTVLPSDGSGPMASYRPSARGPSGLRRLLTTLGWGVAGWMLTIALAVGWACLTTSGSSALIRLLMSRYVRGAQIAVADIDGTLVQGITFHHVTLHQLTHLPPGSELIAEQIHVMLTPRELLSSRLEASELHLRIPGYVEEALASRVAGSLADGFSVHNVELHGLRRLDPAATAFIQRVDVAAPMLHGLDLHQARVSVHNGRVVLPDADPIIVFGRLDGGQLDAQLYSRSLNTKEILQVFPTFRLLRTTIGTLVEVRVDVGGTWHEPLFTGTYRVEKLTRRGFSLVNAPGALQLRLSGLEAAESLQLYGDVTFLGGTLAGPHSSVRLEPSRITFVGDPTVPQFDLRGTSTVKGTSIRIAFKGTWYAPDLTVASSPPLPPDRLLLMLVTGQHWAGTESIMNEGELSPDVARDFIDYFFFGGLGSRLAQRLGISDVSLRYAPETNTIGVTTTIADRMAVTYQAEQPRGRPADQAKPSAEPEPGPTYKIGAEYRVTENTSFKLEGEREFTRTDKTQPLATTTPSTSTAGAVPQTRDEVTLKVERRF